MSHFDCDWIFTDFAGLSSVFIKDSSADPTLALLALDCLRAAADVCFG